MNIFKGWDNHTERIKANWTRLVKPDDTVIMPGDFSWGLKLEETVKDFEFLESLPGKKLLIKGNHDLWWTTSRKLNALYDDMIFLQNSYFAAGDIAVCGTRGWELPQSSAEWTEHDEKIYQRELGRLRMSLEAAKRDGMKRISNTA